MVLRELGYSLSVRFSEEPATFKIVATDLIQVPLTKMDVHLENNHSTIIRFGHLSHHNNYRTLQQKTWQWNHIPCHHIGQLQVGRVHEICPQQTLQTSLLSP
jgi:hypothetical protein